MSSSGHIAQPVPIHHHPYANGSQAAQLEEEARPRMSEQSEGRSDPSSGHDTIPRTSMSGSTMPPKSRDFAFIAPPLEELPPSDIPYLPNATPRSEFHSYVPTSKPCVQIALTPVQQSMQYSLARLLSLPRFLSFLATPLGFSQFKAYLLEDAPHLVTVLDMWHDIVTLRNLTTQTAFASRGCFEVYRSQLDKLPKPLAKEFVDGLRQCTTIGCGLDGTAKHLLESLYASEFQSFMRTRLVKYTRAQLAHYTLSSEDRTGIGAAFVLVNPRLQDRPIVLVSPGFTELTGYRAKQIIGRNCRFLQGKATSPEAVQEIKRAIDSGTETTQLILNYTADARPFMNLLTILPLHDTDSKLLYFIGGQTDLTNAAMTDRGSISLLLPEDEALKVDMTHFSPEVQIEAHETAGVIGTDHNVKRAFGVANSNGPEVVIPSLPPTPPNEATTSPGLSSSMGKVESSTMGSAAGGGTTSHKPVEPPTIEKKRQVKTFCQKLFGKKQSPAKETSPAIEVSAPFVPAPQPRATSQPTPIETVASEWASTYEKLLVVKRDTHQILFATSGFLRFVGLPGATRLQIDRSPLIYLDLLALVVAPNEPDDPKVTKDVQAKVRRALDDGTQTSFKVGIRYKNANSNSFSPPSVNGIIHLAPLQDWFMNCAASAVVFA